METLKAMEGRFQDLAAPEAVEAYFTELYREKGEGLDAAQVVERMEAGERRAPAWCAGCIKTCDPAQTPYCITHALIEAVKGNWEEGLFFCGAEVERVDRMSIVAQVLEEYRTALERA